MNKPAMRLSDIRPAKAADEAAVRAMVFSVLDEYEIEPAPKTTDRDLFDLEGYYNGGGFYVLETAEGQIVGTVGIAPLSLKTCELRKMYLTPRLRGRGFGAKLLKHAIAKARSQGFSHMELNTKRIMEEAIGLFTKYGFAQTASRPIDRRSDQTYILKLDQDAPRAVND